MKSDKLFLSNNQFNQINHREICEFKDLFIYFKGRATGREEETERERDPFPDSAK